MESHSSQIYLRVGASRISLHLEISLNAPSTPLLVSYTEGLVCRCVCLSQVDALLIFMKSQPPGPSPVKQT